MRASPLKNPVVLFNCFISIDNDKNNDEQKNKKKNKKMEIIYAGSDFNFLIELHSHALRAIFCRSKFI